MAQYNGWTNYETWAFSIWIDNDESLRNEMIEQIEQAVENDDPINSLTDLLKEFIQESMPELKGVYLDLLQSAIDEINFREIAENLLG